MPRRRYRQRRWPIRSRTRWPATAPGPDWSGSDYKDSSLALGAPVGGYVTEPTNTSLVTLGDGGNIVLRFNDPVTNDPRHPYGLDFIVFSNAQVQEKADGFVRWQELAFVEISQDGSTWYLIKPSIYPANLRMWAGSPQTRTRTTTTSANPTPPSAAMQSTRQPSACPRTCTTRLSRCLPHGRGALHRPRPTQRHPRPRLHQPGSLRFRDGRRRRVRHRRRNTRDRAGRAADRGRPDRARGHRVVQIRPPHRRAYRAIPGPCCSTSRRTSTPSRARARP